MFSQGNLPVRFRDLESYIEFQITGAVRRKEIFISFTKSLKGQNVKQKLEEKRDNSTMEMFVKWKQNIDSTRYC